MIKEKKYVEKFDQRRFRPTDLGILVNDLLVKNFSEVVDVQFTSQMEESLDAVERGEAKWTGLLSDFYRVFSKTLKTAKTQMRDVKRQEIPTDVMCEKCGSVMLIKFGRHGEFLACKAYPECKNTREFRRDEAGKVVPQEKETTDEKCEKCGSPMVFKRGRFGKFLGGLRLSQLQEHEGDLDRGCLPPLHETLVRAKDEKRAVLLRLHRLSELQVRLMG